MEGTEATSGGSATVPSQAEIGNESRETRVTADMTEKENVEISKIQRCKKCSTCKHSTETKKREAEAAEVLERLPPPFLGLDSMSTYKLTREGDKDVTPATIEVQRKVPSSARTLASLEMIPKMVLSHFSVRIWRVAS